MLVAEEREEKSAAGGSAIHEQLTSDPSSSSGTRGSSGRGGDDTPLVTTLNGRAVPRHTSRVPATAAALEIEKSRRVSALLHMGEGMEDRTSHFGQVGNTDAVWQGMRERYVSGETPTSMYGVDSGDAGGGAETTVIAAAQRGRGRSFFRRHKSAEVVKSSTFSEQLYVTKHFLMDYNTMETVSGDSDSGSWFVVRLAVCVGQLRVRGLAVGSWAGCGLVVPASFFVGIWPLCRHPFVYLFKYLVRSVIAKLFDRFIAT